ncbi:hypothetical protein DV096_15655 [Bradymonadaceae bacterium TMQ3]|nr:hypothetical protein DV096_15655 [Bradymonadaceae bacterium TMQ3]TXC73069.1 AgmX/PglI C-terminal domain-containing protein [Bradymonadales bacterium TMQ1]
MTPHLPAPPHHLALLLALLLSTACATAPDANQGAKSEETPGKVTLNEDPELRAIAQRSLEFHKPALQACFDDWLETVDRADYTSNMHFQFLFHLRLDAENNRTSLIYKLTHLDDTRPVQGCIENHLKQRFINAPDATPTTFLPIVVELGNFGISDSREARKDSWFTHHPPRELTNSQTRETLSRASVARVLQTKKNELHSCYQNLADQLGGYPPYVITVRSLLDIRTDGSIESIRSHSSPTPENALTECVTLTLAGIEFPRPDDNESATFTLPFVFSAIPRDQPHNQAVFLTLSPSS